MERRISDSALCPADGWRCALLTEPPGRSPRSLSRSCRPNVLLIMADDLNNDMGTLRPSYGEDAEHRSPRVARGSIRSRVQPVSAVQPPAASRC